MKKTAILKGVKSLSKTEQQIIHGGRHPSCNIVCPPQTPILLQNIFTGECICV